MAALFRAPKNERNSSGDPEEFRATLVEHLEELRTRIFRALAFIVVAWIVGWFVEPYIYRELNALVTSAIRQELPPGAKYEEPWRNVTDIFLFKLKFSFMLGLIPAFPFILLQLWGFVSPGLTKNERRPFKVIAPLSAVLFFIGAGFCWFCIPGALQWFVGFIRDFPGTSLFQEPGTMVLFLLKLMFAFGLGFQIPVIVYALGAFGLLTARQLMSHWRQVMVIIFFVSAVVTPTADPMTMLMMAIPLSVLFLISVYAVKLTQRHRLKVVEEGEDVE